MRNFASHECKSNKKMGKRCAFLNHNFALAAMVVLLAVAVFLSVVCWKDGDEGEGSEAKAAGDTQR